MSQITGDSNILGTPAVLGTSVVSRGVEGRSTKDHGVVGQSKEGTGVFGISENQRGVEGHSTKDHGVVGQSKDGAGVFGISENQRGVEGRSTKDHGVVGQSKDGTGVFGISENQRGVEGHSTKDHGVVGQSKDGAGIFGISDNSNGIEGRSGSGIGVHGKGGRLAGFFEGDVEVTGDIRLANADCAEDFDVAGAVKIEPGTVMVLGNEGTLFESQQAYDKRVAGVISGAGDYKPGIILDKRQTEGNRQPIALMGKVFCKVDAQFGAIEVGDLLTTSPTPGHAMKTNDPLKAFGAVIGKALRPLKEGQGLIPILIALQ
jgi:hypothetical protein